jgi:hypothetical protein
MLIEDIRHLEEEIVQTRYELSQYLPKPYDDYLRADILSNLAREYSDNPAYRKYLKLLHHDLDPMESEEWAERIHKLAHGQ